MGTPRTGEETVCKWEGQPARGPKVGGGGFAKRARSMLFDETINNDNENN